MRRLIPRPGRDERGVTAVIVGILMTCLVGSVGLGVDSGNLALQRGKVQNSADAAALAIAQDCSKGLASCSTAGAASTASFYVTQNAGGGTATIPNGVSTSGSTFKVNVSKTVPTRFFSIFGSSSKVVKASATASFTGHPVSGSPMLPMGVPYCMWKANQAPATTPLLLRSDLISVVFNVIVQGGVLGRLLTTLLGDLLNVTESCTSPTGINLKMLRGPIWLSGLEGTVNGIFNWNSSVCNLKTGLLDGFLGSTTSAVIPSNCINKLGTSIKKNQVILVPIYVPSSNVLGLGLELDGCVLGICTSVKVPPRLGIKVLGFAPFKITGWNFSGNSNPDASAPPCYSLNLLTHPSASVGCNGIQGYFTKTMVKDPEFVYSLTGADFGASAVALSE